jgi:hypothetical protein
MKLNRVHAVGAAPSLLTGLWNNLRPMAHGIQRGKAARIFEQFTGLGLDAKGHSVSRKLYF